VPTFTAAIPLADPARTLRRSDDAQAWPAFTRCTPRSCTSGPGRAGLQESDAADLVQEYRPTRAQTYPNSFTPRRHVSRLVRPAHEQMARAPPPARTTATPGRGQSCGRGRGDKTQRWSVDIGSQELQTPCMPDERHSPGWSPTATAWPSRVRWPRCLAKSTRESTPARRRTGVLMPGLVARGKPGRWRRR